MKRIATPLHLIATLLIVWLLLTISGSSMAAPSPTPRVAPEVWAQLDRQEYADVMLQLPQADLSYAYTLPDKSARGQWVYQTLRATAEATQGPLLWELERAGVSYQRFWVVNAIRVQLDSALLNRLLQYPQIQQITSNESFRGLEPLTESPMSIQNTNGSIPWGVERVKAPWAWEQGVTGEGVVIAGQDTGYAWQHESLIRAYRGYQPNTGVVSHDYNWHDAIHEIDPKNSGSNPCGLDSQEPCDDNGHGTHTMGTMVGNDLGSNVTGWPQAANYPIGVAPGATWIGCRNMERGWGKPSSYIECFQWFVAPWPLSGNGFDDGDPAKAPDIINNSWSCPPEEGCTADRLSVIEPAVNAADAAGILVVVSASNAGPSCSSITQPPAIYPRSFTVGATDSQDALATFSSRGPITYQGETRIGPDISAPGVAVFSSLPNNQYGYLSGTSMAGPHVVGVAALLLSARPELKGHPEQVRALLTNRADPRTFSQGCGNATPTSIPNNGYGWGIVNIQRALLPHDLFLPAMQTQPTNNY